jgi:hypothetical protein
MEKRMQVYKVGNFNYKPLAYITLNFTNGKEIEDCVKDKYKPHIIKLKTDTLCHLTLTKLKESILTCIEELNNHICNCMICKKTLLYFSFQEKYNKLILIKKSLIFLLMKTYKFKNLDTHKCYNSSFQERIRPYRAIKVILLI